MPVSPTYPGIYLEELPSTTHSVVAAATSNAAVIDWFPQGPVNQAVQITSLNQFNTVFGGLSEGSEGSYAVQQFFLNGGGFIWVVRVVPQGTGPGGSAAEPAFMELALNTSPPANCYVSALNPGTWGNYLAIGLTLQSTPSPPLPSGTPPYTLQVIQLSSPGVLPVPPQQPTVLETYYGISLAPGDPSFVMNVVNNVSQYVQIQPSVAGYVGSPPAETPSSPPTSASPPTGWVALLNGSNGSWASDGSDFTDALLAQLGDSQTTPAIIPALSQIAPAVFNLLLLPAAALLPSGDSSSVIEQAILFCQQNQAFFLVDPPPPGTIQQNPVQVQTQFYPWLGSTSTQPAWVDPTLNDTSIVTWAGTYSNSQNYSAATYYPWLTIPDPANNFQPRSVGPSGTVAGVYAKNDFNQGVWTAPAGTNAVLQGATLSVALNDSDSGILNPLGINALRSFPVYGNIVWGARTLAGSDLLQSQFMYVNVRRLTDFIEQSLVQSLKWAVFQPNAAPLWSSITLEVTSFLAGLFAEGAFQGTTATQAYFVQCNSSTTTPQDILNGVVNVIVGFAPVLPAEFIVLQIELMLGQSAGS
jgi:phage tail sheath protein FI